MSLPTPIASVPATPGPSSPPSPTSLPAHLAHLSPPSTPRHSNSTSTSRPTSLPPVAVSPFLNPFTFSAPSTPGTSSPFSTPPRSVRASLIRSASVHDSRNHDQVPPSTLQSIHNLDLAIDPKMSTRAHPHRSQATSPIPKPSFTLSSSPRPALVISKDSISAPSAVHNTLSKDSVENLRRLSAFQPSSPVPRTPPSPSLNGVPSTPPSVLPPLDKSFMRWSKTASSTSDFGTTRSPPSNFSFHGDAQPSEDGAVKRSSTGTFGGSASGHRWSRVPSSNGSSSGAHDDIGVGSSSHPDLFTDKRAGQSFWEDETVSSESRPRRRPLSMSSASTNTGSNPSHGADNSSAPRQAFRAHTSPPGFFPSPTQKNPSHKAPESDQAINAHLLKTSALNDLRIVPRQRPLPPGLAPATAPPSSGTPLRGGGVKEESVGSSESDFALEHRITPRVRQGHGRKPSKLDQVLGEGAETARVLLEFERRVVDDPLKSPTTSSALPPPVRGHKPSASQPAVPASQAQLIAQSYPHRSHTVGRNPAHGRSASLDSLPSLHPSLSDSVNTVSRLLPPLPLQPLPPLPPHAYKASRNAGPMVPSKNDLSPDQKALLVKRTRKLEQVLGETLSETQIERLVVEPSTSVTTVLTKIDDDAWPTSPPNVRPTQPEWERTDCVPRRSTDDVSSLGSNPGQIGNALNRSGSMIARKAREVLGSKSKAAQADGDLKVYVAREMRVSETSVASVRSKNNQGLGSREHLNGRGLSSPTESMRQQWPEAVDVGEDEALRRVRRMQIAKLHRLLGVPIPPGLVGPTSQDDLVASQSRSSSQSQSSLHGKPSPPRADTPDASFISLNTPVKWTDKFRQTLGGRGGSPSPWSSSGKRGVGDGDSFMEMGEEAGFGAHFGAHTPKLTEKEKVVARRRAHKLEQVFGDAPPQSLYVSSVVAPAQAYDAYHDSLQGLLYMVEHDRDRLVSIVDSLDDDDKAGESYGYGYRDESPPMSPRYDEDEGHPREGFDPNSHAARRRRTGKLSHFFGESGIDFTLPADSIEPPAPSGSVNGRTSLHMGGTVGRGGGAGVAGSGTGGKGKSGQGKGKRRRETLDGILGEMWRGVQTEYRTGVLGRDEADRLGDLMRRLRGREDGGGWEEL